MDWQKLNRNSGFDEWLFWQPGEYKSHTPGMNMHFFKQLLVYCVLYIDKYGRRHTVVSWRWNHRRHYNRQISIHAKCKYIVQSFKLQTTQQKMYSKRKCKEKSFLNKWKWNACTRIALTQWYHRRGKWYVTRRRTNLILKNGKFVSFYFDLCLARFWGSGNFNSGEWFFWLVWWKLFPFNEFRHRF